MGGDIGFMQGRLSPPVDGRIQAFPRAHWRDEFRLAAENGFALVEWTLDQDGLHENPLMTASGRAEIEELSARHGVRVGSLTGDCFMQAPWWKAEGAERAVRLDDFRAVLEAAGALGIRHVVLPLVDDGSLDNELEAGLLHEGIKGVRTLLREAGLVIAFESDFMPDDLGSWIAAFPREVGINYDIGNSAALGYDAAEEIAAYGHRIVNVHVKDRLLGGTTVPLGTGAADLPGTFRRLREAGYEGDYILQTARAADGDDVGAARRYRDMVRGWIAAAEAAP